MTVSPGLDIDWMLIEDIDWDYEPPCEHEDHPTLHSKNEVATWFMHSICPHCSKQRFGLRCQEAVDRVMKVGHFRCLSGCKQLALLSDEKTVYELRRL